MTAKKIGGWIEQNANTVVGALVSAMLIANITLYANRRMKNGSKQRKYPKFTSKGWFYYISKYIRTTS